MGIEPRRHQPTGLIEGPQDKPIFIASNFGMNVGFRIVWKDFRDLVFGNPKAGKECLVEFGCSPGGPDPDTLTGDIQFD